MILQLLLSHFELCFHFWQHLFMPLHFLGLFHHFKTYKGKLLRKRCEQRPSEVQMHWTSQNQALVQRAEGLRAEGWSSHPFRPLTCFTLTFCVVSVTNAPPPHSTIRPGSPVPVNTDNPGVRKAARFGVYRYNNSSNDLFLFKESQIKKAMVQVRAADPPNHLLIDPPMAHPRHNSLDPPQDC